MDEEEDEETDEDEEEEEDDEGDELQHKCQKEGMKKPQEDESPVRVLILCDPLNQLTESYPATVDLVVADRCCS